MGKQCAWIWESPNTYVRALAALHVVHHGLPVFKPRAAVAPLVALFREKLPELAPDPAGAAVHQKHGRRLPRRRRSLFLLRFVRGLIVKRKVSVSRRVYEGLER